MTITMLVRKSHPYIVRRWVQSMAECMVEFNRLSALDAGRAYIQCPIEQILFIRDPDAARGNGRIEITFRVPDVSN